MARPKQRINEANKDDIYRYFSVFFSEDRFIFRNKRSRRSNESNLLFKDGKGNLIEMPFIARDAFNLIEPYKIDMLKLQQWVDNYASERLWKMCLNSLYQKKFLYHGKMLYTVKITQPARDTLNFCKSKTDMSVDQMLEKAIDLLYYELIKEK